MATTTCGHFTVIATGPKQFAAITASVRWSLSLPDLSHSLPPFETNDGWQTMSSYSDPYNVKVTHGVLVTW